MWFFPPIELNKERTIFIRLIALSSAAHLFMLIAMFLGHLFSDQTLILKGMGARVSVSGKRRAHAMPAAPQAMPQSAPTSQSEPVKQVSPEQTPSKQATPERSERVTPKKAEKATPERATAERAIVPAKKKSKKEEQKEEKAPPAFSELKKKFTSLRKHTEPAKPAQKSVEPQVKEESKPLQQSSTPVPTTERLELGVEENYGDEPDEGTAQSGIVGEISHHYRRPPGFDDHEPFLFTFEIKDGRAVNISPKGSEPLVIYSAVKEAILKSSFAVYKQSRKIELLVKSN